MFLVGASAPAFAQYGRPAMDEPPLGEQYHIEGTFDFWSPGLDATISSESLGILGSDINVKTDLGYQDKQVREFRLVLRPGKKHKFRLAYTPVDYTGDVILSRDLVFNGIKFNVGLPIQTQFQWDTWRFGYEYDFVYTDKFYVGFIAEVRQTDAQLQLQSPVDDEFTRARGPVPAIGGSFRVYPEKHVSITAEFTGFKLPQVQNYQGDFFDFDIYGTVSFVRYFGVQLGLRTLDASYIAKKDTGELKLKGVYFSGVARF